MGISPCTVEYVLLTKSVRKNHGEVPQYYIKDSHPAIIDPETFDLVQEEIELRRPNRHKLHRSSPFTAKIICGDCSSYYGRKVWHSNCKHRKYIWRCNDKYETETACSTPNLEEQLAETQNEHARLMDNLRRYMEENTRQIQNQEEYNRRFSELDAECKEAEQQIAAIQKELLAQSGRKEQIRRCLDELRECGDILEEFDLDLWNSMVGSVTVYTDKKLAFLFRDGTKINLYRSAFRYLILCKKRLFLLKNGLFYCLISQNMVSL